VPFLPVRDDFHPKRNQARQKLATLPRNRFKDLASDVFFELNRRFPEFEAEHVSHPGKHNAVADHQDGEDAFADPPPAPGPRHPFSAAGSSSHLYPDQAERSRMDPTPPPIARLNSASSSHRRQASRNVSGGSSVGSSGIPGHRQRPSRDEGNSRGQPNPTATTSDMVVPNKSRMREEEIEVPYARDSMIMDEPRAQSRSSNRPGSRSSFQDQRGTPTGMRQDSGDVMSPASADDREYYDRMSFSSNVTNKSKLPTGSGGYDEKEQKIRSDYELKIAGLERRLQAAERDRDDARRQEAFEAERRREMEDELRGMKEVSHQPGNLLTYSEPPHMRLRYAHYSMSWISPKTPQKPLEHMASRTPGAPKRRRSIGNVAVKHSKMSYAISRRADPRIVIQE